MTPKEFLSQYRVLTRRIKYSFRQIEDMNEMMLDISANYSTDIKVQSSGHSDRLGEAVARLVSEKDRLLDEINEMLIIKETIETTIGNIKSDLHRDLLTERYINLYTWERIAEDLHMDVRSVYRIHGKALNMIRFIPNLAPHFAPHSDAKNADILEI